MKKNVLIVIIAVVLLGLFVLIGIWVKPPAFLDPRKAEIDALKEEIRLNDSIIAVHLMKLDSLKKANGILQTERDSLDSLKQKVIIRYHEIYVGLNGASNKHLDSIIRSNW